MLSMGSPRNQSRWETSLRLHISEIRLIPISITRSSFSVRWNQQLYYHRILRRCVNRFLDLAMKQHAEHVRWRVVPYKYIAGRLLLLLDKFIQHSDIIREAELNNSNDAEIVYSRPHAVTIAPHRDVWNRLFFILVWFLARFLKNSDSVRNEFGLVQLKRTRFGSDIIVIYYSLIVNLQQILQRQWMTRLCRHWRNSQQWQQVNIM